MTGGDLYFWYIGLFNTDYVPFLKNYISNETLIVGLGTFILSLIPITIAGGFFTLMDFLHLPFWETRRLRPKNADFFKPGQFTKCVTHVLKAQLTQLLPYLFFVAVPLMKWRGCKVNGPLPDYGEMFLHILFAAFVNDALFYWLHRLAHTKTFYKFHKLHHEHKAPFSLAAEYASPLELILVDATPILVGPLIIGSHLYTQYVWIIIRLLYTMEIHSGMDIFIYRLIPFYGGAPVHDTHHKLFNCNYSDCFTLWDRLCGTYIEPPPLGTADNMPDGKPKQN